MPESNSLPMTNKPALDQVIRTFMLETEQRERGTLYSGNSAFQESATIDRLLTQAHPTWVEQANWRDGWYRVVWVNEADRAVLSYAEGDMSMMVCPDEERFQAELEHNASFYEAPYVKSGERTARR